jgi:lipoyl(octanoyl) transferase
MELTVVRAGRVPYRDALDLQYRIHAARREGRVGDLLLLLEHPPVITIGAGGKRDNVLATAGELEAAVVEVVDITRGGDVTYHGPGQLVGYPILDLNGIGRDIHVFVHRIEEAFIGLLRDGFGIRARQLDAHTGVWVGDDKIVAIGIAVRHWVTMHGFAFNVNTNLEHFDWIVPCGIKDKGVTSVERLLGRPADFDAVTGMTAERFARAFGMTPAEKRLEELDV